jgi:hypothetical protein
MNAAASGSLGDMRAERSPGRLKELGLTESLETGYRISARGRALLRDLDIKQC